MTDKELLELAAKAAGIRLEWDFDPAKWQPQYYEGKTYHNWNPLEDDALALRLAVKLRLFESGQLWDKVIGYRFEYEGEDDPYAATRRAIVRAAAEIGRSHD